MKKRKEPTPFEGSKMLEEIRSRVKIEEVVVNDIPVSVLILGASPVAACAVSSLRINMKTELTKRGHLPKLSEELVDAESPHTAKKQHLVHGQHFDLIIYLPTNYDSIAEINDSISDDRLNKRMMIFFDKTFNHGHNFQGLLETAALQTYSAMAYEGEGEFDMIETSVYETVKRISEIKYLSGKMGIKEKMQFDLIDYPHSVLHEDSIVVLTWIEKLGLATCTELSIDLGMEGPEIGSIVTKLLDNKLIQFYNGFIQPSEKGKYVIDKFETFHRIIVHTISFEEMTHQEDVVIRSILKLYRNNHYTNYLFTLNSLKVWERLCVKNGMVLDCEGILKEFLLAIFIYDLKKVSQGTDFLNEKPLYFSLLYYNSPLQEMSFINKAVLHLKSFNSLMSTSDFRKFAAPMKDFFEYLYCKDHFFANKIQTQLINDLEMKENETVDQIFCSHFNTWRKEFLGGRNKNDRLTEIDITSLLKESGEEKNTIIDPRLVPKLNTSLSENELALMVRLYINVGIIINKSEKEVMEFITRFLNTTEPDRSTPAFKEKYENISMATIQKCKHWLKKLLDKLEEYKKGL